MPLPDELDVQAALIYFHAYMYGPYQGRVRLFRLRGLEPRMVMSEDWEVFASILLRQQGSVSRSGPDLGTYEVKSALTSGSFEYQYHRKSWQEKLAATAAPGMYLFGIKTNYLRLKYGSVKVPLWRYTLPNGRPRILTPIQASNGSVNKFQHPG